MVTTNAYTWTEFTTGTTANVLYGSHLNYNFDYVSALVNKGITGANIADAAITSGAVNAYAITHGHLNFNLDGGCRVMKIGKAWATTGGQFFVKGSSLVTTTLTDATGIDVTVYYTNGDVCTTNPAEPMFKAAPLPMVDAKVYISNNSTAGCCNYRVATNCFTVNVHLGGVDVFSASYVLYWQAVGNVA